MHSSYLITGKIHHIRHSGPQHLFCFPYWGLYLNLDSYTTDLKSLLTKKIGLFSFRKKDHGERIETQNLKAFARKKWQNHNIFLPEDTSIYLSCFPRQMGYVFNPLSIYWAYHKGILISVLLEVRNTVGGMHHYVHQPQHPETVEKVFYVSPFIDGECSYDFKVMTNTKGFKVKISVKNRNTGQKIMTAFQKASFQDLRDQKIIKLILQKPMQSYQVMLQILWHALILKIKGAVYHPPNKANYTDQKEYVEKK